MGRRARNMAKQLGHMRLGLLLFACFIAFTVVSGLMLRTTLLESAHESNSALARYYATETNSTLTTYRSLLEFGTASIDQRIENGSTWAELKEWVQLFCTRIRSVLGDESINVYGVVDGTPLTVGDGANVSSRGASPSMGDFDVTKRDWYQDAIAAHGSIVFSDVYADALTGENVVTVAQACRDDHVVLAFDLYPENFRFQYEQQDLPDGYSFYLCDGLGNPLYCESSLANNKDMDAYLHKLVARIGTGELAPADAYIIDLDGRERAVDYMQLANGWYSIVTAPREVILGQLRTVMMIFSVMIGAFAVTLVVLTLRDLRRAKTMERTNETVRVLGNSYYAIYLVNYEDSTYEMIKGSDYVRTRIPKKGPYGDLLRTAAEVIEKDTFEEFEESFSAQSIRALVADRVRDYGGDFMRRFGDTYRWVNVRVLYDESLAPEEVVLCFRQVDQEKQRQLQERHYLEEALETSQRSIEARQAFFNNMSHDMRTPLNAVIGLTELARRHVDDPEQTAVYLERIGNSGKQLLALINDILDISRMEQGAVSFNNERMDLERVVVDCAAPFQMQAQQEGKRFELKLNIADTQVMGDALRLSQVLNNLISNAVKYSESGDEIRVSVEQLADHGECRGAAPMASYRIVVADTGFGMTEEFQGRLFELYAREQRFGVQQKVGTGLGMPITKNLVEQMGGTIEVKSKLDEGSTFTVVIPLGVIREDGSARSASEQDDATSAADEAPRPETQKENAPVLSSTPKIAAPVPTQEELLARLEGKRVLLAEDNAVNMEIATEMLGVAGLEVTQAWNGREAYEAFAASEPGHFDAVLLDMKMPKWDGCEAARAIRALDRPDAATVPLIAVTANAFAEDIVATTAAGMNAHVSKPIDFSLLCRTLADLMGPSSPSDDSDAADPGAESSEAGGRS